jgi:hypothetical protein
MDRKETNNSNIDMGELPTNYVLALENSIRLDERDKEDITLFSEIKPLDSKKKV